MLKPPCKIDLQFLVGLTVVGRFHQKLRVG